MIPDCYMLCALASKLAAAFWLFDSGINNWTMNKGVNRG